MTRRRRREQPIREQPPSTLPACPTLALPGTAAKVDVMEARALRREALFHPADLAEEVDRPAQLPKTRRIRRPCEGRGATVAVGERGERAVVF